MIYIDVSVQSQKGLGRFLDSLINSLDYLDYPMKFIGHTTTPFSFRSFFRRIPITTNTYIFPHINFPILSFFLSSRTFIVIHDVIPFERPNLKYAIWRIYLFIFLRKKNVSVICPSNFSLEKASAMFLIAPERCYLLYNQYNNTLIQNYNHDNTSEIPQFVYVGNNLPHKNLDTLLSAFKAVHSLNSDAKLHLVLGVSLKQSKPLQIPYMLKDSIVIHSSLSDSQLFSLISSCCALVQPSFVEGFGVPILEALIIGTPVIASNIPVFKELFGKSLYYFDPRSSLDLSNIMLSLDSTKYISSQLICEVVSKFSLSSTSNQLKNILGSDL